MRIRSAFFAAVAVCTTLGLAAATVSLSAAPPARKAAPPAHSHQHGPHGGELLPLGDEEYHAEVVHDEKARVFAIYILDAAGKQEVTINAKEVLVNVARNGKPMQYKLAAAPQASDPEGFSSLFLTKDENLQAALDAHGVDARLQVTIAGRPYAAKIVHHHHHGAKTVR